MTKENALFTVKSSVVEFWIMTRIAVRALLFRTVHTFHITGIQRETGNLGRERQTIRGPRAGKHHHIILIVLRVPGAHMASGRPGSRSCGRPRRALPSRRWGGHKMGGTRKERFARDGQEWLRKLDAAPPPPGVPGRDAVLLSRRDWRPRRRGPGQETRSPARAAAGT